MHVIVDELMTHYERAGKGKVVLLLHGWGDTGATFHALGRSLRAKYDVIALDLPGFGGTMAPKEPWGLNDYGLFVRDFLKKIDVKKVYTLVGHSNGGAIAIRALARNDLHADRLVLLASAGFRGEYKGRNRLIRYVTKTGKVLTKPLPHRAKKRLRQAVYDSVGSDMLVAEHLQETFKKVVTDDVADDAPKLKQPVLLVYGDKDTSTPLRYGERFQDLMLHAKLEVIPGAGHFLLQENADDVERLVAGFLV